MLKLFEVESYYSFNYLCMLLIYEQIWSDVYCSYIEISERSISTSSDWLYCGTHSVNPNNTNSYVSHHTAFLFSC